MPNHTQHECAAVAARRDLIIAIKQACGETGDSLAVKGTEAELMRTYSVLTGIVAEFTNGGDEMAEGCTCPPRSASAMVHKDGNKGVTFKQLDEVYHTRALDPGADDAC